MLKRTADRKVSPVIRKTAKSTTVKSKNSFGLPAGNAFSCPGATSVCETICYANKLEKLYKGVKELLMHNWAILKDANTVRMALELDNMIVDFERECEKIGAEKIFRIHWDGDFFSSSYAIAWAEVIEAHPDVLFWVYTRSFVPALNVIPIIAGIDNLNVYLSIDSDNVEYAKNIIGNYPDVMFATLANTATEAKEMMPERIISCPENVGKRLPLVVDKNNDGNAKGACAACGLCVNARNNVAFAISGKE